MLKTFILAGGIIVMFKLLNNNNPNFENVKSEFYRFIYNCIYYYSVCQLKYKKLCRYFNPYLHYIYSSENQYREEMCPLLKSNSAEQYKNNICVSFYNNTRLVKTAIYNYDSHCAALDLNLFMKNVEPVNYNLIIMSLLEKQRETENNSKQYDMIIFTIKNMSDFKNVTKYEVSNIKFISINLIHNNNTYQILLKTPEYNFYIVDNIIDASFFKYYLVAMLKEKNNELDNNFSYTLEIMDHNVNMFTLNEKQSIIFKKDSYDILQCDTTREIVIEKIDSVSKIDTVDTSRY